MKGLGGIITQKNEENASLMRQPSGYTNPLLARSQTRGDGMEETQKIQRQRPVQRSERLINDMNAMFNDGTVMLPNLPKYALNAIEPAAT